jgi:hypothetical protein
MDFTCILSSRSVKIVAYFMPGSAEAPGFLLICLCGGRPFPFEVV